MLAGVQTAAHSVQVCRSIDNACKCVRQRKHGLRHGVASSVLTACHTPCVLECVAVQRYERQRQHIVRCRAKCLAYLTAFSPIMRCKRHDPCMHVWQLSHFTSHLHHEPRSRPPISCTRSWNLLHPRLYVHSQMTTQSNLKRQSEDMVPLSCQVLSSSEQ